jgi:hypothetical protein
MELEIFGHGDVQISRSGGIVVHSENTKIFTTGSFNTGFMRIRLATATYVSITGGNFIFSGTNITINGLRYDSWPPTAGNNVISKPNPEARAKHGETELKNGVIAWDEGARLAKLTTGTHVNVHLDTLADLWPKCNVVKLVAHSHSKIQLTSSEFIPSGRLLVRASSHATIKSGTFEVEQLDATADSHATIKGFKITTRGALNATSHSKIRILADQDARITSTTGSFGKAKITRIR